MKETGGESEKGEREKKGKIRNFKLFQWVFETF